MSDNSFNVDATLRAKLRVSHIHVWEEQNCNFKAQVWAEPPFAPMVGLTASRPAEFGAFSFSFSHLKNVGIVGRYCSIAGHVEFGAFEHPTDRVSTSSFTYDPTYIWKTYSEAVGTHFAPSPLPDDGKHGAVNIGHDVWIGVGAYIKGGVTIGNGAIIGAHAVVTHDVPPYAVVAGNPGRIVKYRIEPEIAATLQALGWWNYAYTDFAGLPIDDPLRFIDAFRRRAENGDLQPYTPDKIDLGALFKELIE